MTVSGLSFFYFILLFRRYQNQTSLNIKMTKLMPLKMWAFKLIKISSKIWFALFVIPDENRLNHL